MLDAVEDFQDSEGGICAPDENREIQTHRYWSSPNFCWRMRCVLSPIESSFVVFFLSRSLAEDWYGPLIPLPISRGSGALSQQVTGDAAPEAEVAKNTKITAAQQKQFASISYYLVMMMLVVMMIGCDSLVKHKSEAAAAAVSASEADLAQQEKSHRGTDQRFCSWQIWHCNEGDEEVFMSII